MKVAVTPVREIRILGLDKRSVENILWCAVSYRADRLFWADGYLLCIENYEDAMDYEVKEGIFPLGQICYAKFPKYVKYHEVEKGLQIPIANVSDVQLYKEIVKTIKEEEINRSEEGQ